MSNQMILKPLFLSILLMVGGVLSSSAVGIPFETGTWDEVLTKAKKEDKIIFVDAFATWCGPCKTMSREVFTDPEVGDYFSENFINYKFDMELGEGIAFSDKYEVTAYPTLLLINSNGEVLARKVGGADTPSFIMWAKESIHPELSPLRGFERDYANGERDTTFLYAYIEALAERDQYDQIQKISKTYLDQIEPAGLMEVEPFVVFMYNPTSVLENPYWDYFFSHYDEFVLDYGKYAYQKMSSTLEYNYEIAIEEQDEALFGKLIDIMVWAEEPEDKEGFLEELWEMYREEVE